MAFVKLGSEYINDGFTQVDNVFLLSYLPSAEPLDTKIYLFGLALASCGEDADNQIGKMALSLQISEERVMEGYKYWEKKGLVSISKTNPSSIKYLSVKRPLTPIVKFNTEKYSSFVEEVERLFPTKIFNQNEYNALMELIEYSGMELNAMLLIMQYCSDLKKVNVSTPYILAVANDWIKEGLLTEKQIDEHIAELENNSEAIRAIFKKLGIKRIADLDDRQMYLRWTRQMKYELDAILTAAGALKRRGGMERLDKYIQELSKASAFTAEEISQYTKSKEELYNLAKNVTKNLGTYYGDLDMVIEIYISKWLGKGFEKEALLKLAKFSFMRSVRTFEGLEVMVESFYKMGLMTSSAIDGYISSQIALDAKIREVYHKCGYFGNVTKKDRENYRLWIEWNIDEEVIDFVAAECFGKPFPMQSINRILGTLHTKGIKTLKEAEKELGNTFKQTQKPKDEYMKHEYTDEQLKSVLINFEDSDF